MEFIHLVYNIKLGGKLQINFKFKKLIKRTRLEDP